MQPKLIGFFKKAIFIFVLLLPSQTLGAGCGETSFSGGSSQAGTEDLDGDRPKTEESRKERTPDSEDEVEGSDATGNGEEGRAESPEMVDGYLEPGLDSTLTGDETDSSAGGGLDDDEDGSDGEREGDETVPELFVSEGEVLEACRTRSHLTLDDTLDFPALAGSCPFGQGDNSSAREQRMSARRSQNALVELPDGAVLCSLRLRSGNSSVRYDDAIFFNVDGFHLFNSWAGFTRHLPEEEGLRLWDWEAVRGQTYVIAENTPYCWGRGDRCQMPRQQTSGSFDISFSAEAIAKLGLEAAQDGALEFTLVTTGDNDPSDCSHSGLRMEVSLKYILPGEAP